MPGRQVVGVHPRREVPVREPPARLGEAGERRREPVGEERRDEHGDEERDAGHDQDQRRDVGEGRRAARVRVRQRHEDAPLGRVVGRLVLGVLGRDRRVAHLPRVAAAPQLGLERQVRVRHHGREAVGVGSDEADRHDGVRLCDPARGQIEERAVEDRACFRVEDQRAVRELDDDGLVVGDRHLHERTEDLGRRVGAGSQPLLLELAEVVVEAVDDHRRHEDERQRDDAHERERQAGLERLGHGRTELARVTRLGLPAGVEAVAVRRGALRGCRRVRPPGVGHVSARRTGSRRPGRSARTAAWRDRPRSSRAGGSRGR